LKVGIIGDQTHYSFDGNLEKPYQILSQGIEILSKENVACVLHTGDLLESSVSPEKYRAQFAQAKTCSSNWASPGISRLAIMM